MAAPSFHNNFAIFAPACQCHRREATVRGKAFNRYAQFKTFQPSNLRLISLRLTLADNRVAPFKTLNAEARSKVQKFKVRNRGLFKSFKK
jgi:hypothetical protein